MYYFKKSFSLLLISLLTLTTLNLSYAQLNDTDDTEELECTTLSYSMRLGSRDSSTNGEVSKLQVFLSQANYLDSDPTGYYGNATRKAVRSFQQDNRLVVTGTIGAVSRAKIKALSCNTSYTNPVTPVSPVTVNPADPNRPIVEPFRSVYKRNGQSCDITFKDAYDKTFVDGEYYNMRDCEASININSKIIITGVQKTGITRSLIMDAPGPRDNEIEITGKGLNNISSIRFTETNKISRSVNIADFSSNIQRSDFKSASETSIKFWYRTELRTTFALNITPINYKNESAGSYTVQLGEANVQGMNRFELKAPTDIERGNVITTIKAGAYMNICWDKSTDYTDQLIKIVLMNSIGEPTNLGNAYLSQNCYSTSIPNNTQPGTNSIYASLGTGFMMVGSLSPSFEVVGNDQNNPTLSSTFNPIQLNNSSTVEGKYNYQILNYRDGLVLDIEISTKNCLETGNSKKDCSKYIFDLRAKGGVSYTNVVPYPYAIADSQRYRFNGKEGSINIAGLVDPQYTPIYPYVNPVPQEIHYTFTLRDTKNGGAIVSSETKSYSFPR